jgi:hypothetical protein
VSRGDDLGIRGGLILRQMSTADERRSNLLGKFSGIPSSSVASFPHSSCLLLIWNSNSN